MSFDTLCKNPLLSGKGGRKRRGQPETWWMCSVTMVIPIVNPYPISVMRFLVAAKWYFPVLQSDCFIPLALWFFFSH